MKLVNYGKWERIPTNYERFCKGFDAGENSWLRQAGLNSLYKQGLMSDQGFLSLMCWGKVILCDLEEDTVDPRSRWLPHFLSILF